MSPCVHGIAGNARTASLVVENRMEALGHAERWLDELLVSWTVAPTARFALALVANEALTNIVRHAYRDRDVHDIAVTLTRASDAVSIEIVDDGEAFDPFAAAAREPVADLANAPVGGRGIGLIKHFADSHRYRRTEGCNHLILSVRVPR